MKKNAKNKFLPLLTDNGRKVIKLTALMLFFSLSCYAIDYYILKPRCEIDKKSSECYFSSMMGNFGGNIIQTWLTILFFEIGLKRETLREIEEIVKETQPTKYLRGFYSKKEDYEEIIKTSFKAVNSGDEIKILCLFETEIYMLCAEDFRKIKDKVLSGCKIKILILHPESKLLECLERAGHITKSAYQNRSKVFLDKLSALFDELNKCHTDNSPIKGTIEVKLHKDLFSPIGYYSDSKDCRLVWMYFADTHAKGSEYPALHIANKEIIDDVEKHFEHLWSKATGKEIFLMRVTPDSKETIDKIKTVSSNTGGN